LFYFFLAVPASYLTTLLALCIQLFSLTISDFLLTSYESCDLETATAIFTYHITHYTTPAIMHAHFGSVKTNLNYRTSSIYGASVQRAATTKTKRHIEAENDMLE
jgi:ABC-type protease/lipase transport system fused ATPase/permease subunit